MSIDDDLRDPDVGQPGQHRSAPKQTAMVFWVLLALGVAGWIYAVATAPVRDLGSWGLFDVLPAIWYVGVGLTVLLLVSQLASGIPSPARAGAALGSLVIMLYGNAAAIEPVPQFPWTYKHIGVTSSIVANGAVNPNGDIYNHWPGFFSLMAFLGNVTGFDNAVSFAAWAEPSSALLATVLVLLIARQLTPNRNTQWLAAAIFATTGWVGQYYYSPQSENYVLFLAALLIVLTALRAEPRRWGLWIERKASAVCRVPATERVPVRRSTTALQRVTVVVFAVLVFVISASHQLTPYVLALVVIPLCLAGYIRPLYVGIIALVIPVAYLAPNFEYVQSRFRVVRELDVVTNVTSGTVTAPATGPTTIVTYLEYATTALLVVLAICGLARRVRAGHPRTAVLGVWLALAPALTLVVQSYGGEGRLRVVLFALPFLAIATAWLFHPLNDTTPETARTPHLAPLLGRRSAGALVALLAVVLTPELLQPVSDNQISRNTVAAAEWIDSHAGRRDLLVSVAPNIVPFLVGKNYGSYINDSVRSLSAYQSGFERELTPTDVLNSIRIYDEGTPNAYIVTSPDQRTWVERHDLLTGAQISRFEQELPAAGGKLVYERGDTKVYKLPVNS